MSLIEFARGDHASHQCRHLDPELEPWSPDTLGTWPARPTQLELTDGRQLWVRLLIFVVPGPAQDNRSRREGDICLVAAVNLTP